MGVRQTVKVTGVLAAAVMAIAACSGDDGESATTEPKSGPIVTESTQFDDEVFIAESTAAPAPGSTPDCPVDAVEVEKDWPFDLPVGFVPDGFEIEDLRYETTGVTSDAEGVLVAAFDDAFADYEPLEPTGGATDIAVDFESIRGGARLAMTDDDDDGCWDVSISATYQAPDAVLAGEQADNDQTAQGQPEPTTATSGPAIGDPGDPGDPDDPDTETAQDPDEQTAEEQAAAEAAGETTTPSTATPTTVDPVASEEFDNAVAVGRGEIITRRGTFPLRVTSCELDNQTSITVEAFAVEGTVVIESFGPEALSVIWTYADGVIIGDPDAKVLSASVSGLFVVGDGEGPDGAETVIVDLQCDR